MIVKATISNTSTYAIEIPTVKSIEEAREILHLASTAWLHLHACQLWSIEHRVDEIEEVDSEHAAPRTSVRRAVPLATPRGTSLGRAAA